MKAVFWELSAENDEETPNFILENDVPIPCPGRNEVQVKVKSCGLSSINFKFLEKLFRKYPDRRKQYIVGHDVSGIVTQLGEGASTFKVGDAVVGILPLDNLSPGCAEFCIFHEYDIVKKPEMLSFEDAACGIGDCVRAYTALHCLCRLCAGDTLLVIGGATSFSNIVIQLALSWGAKVIATANSPEERKYITSNHPTVAQVIESTARKNMLSISIMEETGGLGVDFIIDNGASRLAEPKENHDQSTSLNYEMISCLGSFGKWVTMRSDLQLDPPDSSELFLRSGTICFLFDSLWTLSYSQHGRYRHILSDVVDKLDRGLLKTKTSKTIGIDEVVKTMQVISESTTGKVIVQL